MKRKFVSRVLCAALSSLLVVSGIQVPVSAQTLSEAGLEESGRGYGGNGTQNKSREEDEITVSVTIGAGGTDASWTGLEELTPYIANDDVEMLNRHVSFGDEDSDGDIDATDLFKSLESLKRGDTAFNATSSEMGDFYSDMFGIGAGGSFTYWINGNYCQYGTPDLYDRDNVIVVAFTGDYNAWGSTDDSAYDGYKSDKKFTSLQAIMDLDSWDVPSKKRDKYLKKMDEALASGYTETTTGTGFWQQLRIARFAEGTDKEAFANYQRWYSQNHGVTLGSNSTNDMRVLSVTESEQAANNLLYGPGLTIDDVEDSSEALVYDKKAGMYAMDYILMALDLTGAGLEDDDLTNTLSDYTTTVSVRDDLVYTILNTSGCWGGGWFTYDTGCQNAQSLVPYYNRYSEVKSKLDEFEAEAYTHFMDSSYTGSSFDASCAGEYIRFAAMLSEEKGDATLAQHATDVYDKIEEIGLENTKYKGNTMDIWRMAIAEWGLEGIAPVPPATSVFRMYADQASGLTNSTVFHMQALEDITDAILYETELTVPDGVTVNNVTSTVADVNYGVQDGVLRVVVANLDGTPLNILKDSDVFQVNITAEVGEVEFGVVSSTLRASSENSRDAKIKTEKTEIVDDSTITATVLYKGSETSRFISKGLQAVKVSIATSKDITGTLQYKVGDKYYDCYRTADFASADEVKNYVGLIPSSVTVEALQDPDNYSVADKTTANLIFGDTDGSKEINSADALWVIKLWVGKITEYTDLQTLAGNVTKDSDIDNSDTLSIVGHIVNSEQFKVLQ